MLSSIEILILSAIQGISEFLPISSAAHLVFVSKYYSFVNQNLLIDICLHLGSLIAIIVYFRNDLFNFIKNKDFWSWVPNDRIPVTKSKAEPSIIGTSGASISTKTLSIPSP